LNKKSLDQLSSPCRPVAGRKRVFHNRNAEFHRDGLPTGVSRKRLSKPLLGITGSLGFGTENRVKQVSTVT
jgi:hypothetical protein